MLYICRNNTKITWSILNKVIRKQSDKYSLPDTFKINNQNESNRRNIAHEFNNLFSTSVIPNQLKIGKLTLCINLELVLFNNYRQISILPAYSKLLYKLIFMHSNQSCHTSTHNPIIFASMSLEK